jgi:hypothetical protein
MWMPSPAKKTIVETGLEVKAKNFEEKPEETLAVAGHQEFLTKRQQWKLSEHLGTDLGSVANHQRNRPRLMVGSDRSWPLPKDH